jgi:drug/metabolite transporter (DMT)-like permease
MPVFCWGVCQAVAVAFWGVNGHAELATIGMGIVILDEPMNAWIAGGTLLVASGVYRATRTAVRN